MVPAIDILAQNSTRWSDFLWRISARTIHHPAFHAIRGKLPRLKNLEVFSCPSNGDIDQEAQSATGLDIFAECPSLSSVQFSPDLTGGIQFPSAQIRSLGLRVSYTTKALRILSGFPNIASLELFRVGGGKACQNHFISDLKRLSIKATDQNDVSSILNHTTLQSLSVLQISGVTEASAVGWEKWDSVPIKDFLLRSSCRVTTLHLCYLPITSEQTISLLPSLRELHVKERKVNNSCNKIVTGYLLESLQISFCHFAGDLRALIPRLTDLLLAVYPDDLNTDALMRVVTSRWLPDADDAAEAGIDCLRSIVIILRGEKLEAGENCKLSPLLDFRDAGLRVNIESSSS
uniref:Uncharacterized protein n=1 Tax=Moniliophthora roreri TaxID=221103 RepID=A0A0W0G697_MONRR